MTTTEIVLTLIAGVTIAVAVILTPAARSLLEGPKYGLWPLGLLIAFTMLSGLSVMWSVQPDASWQDAGRLLAYSAVFAAAIALVRLAPDRWAAILGGLTLAAVVVCAYALMTKVFPGALAPNVTYARLEEPYGYWNAIGLTAAMGAIGCMWLGARRAGHALLSALAYPAMGIVLVTLMLAYSRGALAALAIGLVVWFCIVPLRLRGATVLIASGLGAAAVVGWDFSRHALTTENIPLAERSTAGHELGALLVAMILVLALAGIAIGFLGGRHAPSRAARNRAGVVLLALVAIAAVAFAGALAHSQRGFTGSISHAVDSLTNPNAKPPPNTPGRLTAVASVRARYWKQAIEVFEANPVLGAGADGYETASLRYRTAPLEVKHAHGFIVQTMADLGAIGLTLALALLLCWMAAAGRATHPFNRRWRSWGAWLSLLPGSADVSSDTPPSGAEASYATATGKATGAMDGSSDGTGTPGGGTSARDAGATPGERPGWRALDPRTEPQLVRYTPERVALLSMLCLVIVFGVHSVVDWTWYVPGDAFAALLCAGWLAGRGPLEGWRSGAAARSVSLPRSLPEAHPLPAERRAPGLRSGGIAIAVVIAALLAAWSQWQPQRSADASQEALDLVSSDPPTALAKAQTAVARDPLSAQALITLATIQQSAGEPALARATLQRAVRLQPANPQTWLALARYELPSEPAAALKALQATVFLNPESISAEAIAPPYPNAESVEIYNDYVQALRATGAAGGASSSTAATTGASRPTTGAVGASAAGTSATGAATSVHARPAPAAAAVRRARLHTRARRALESRTP